MISISRYVFIVFCILIHSKNMNAQEISLLPDEINLNDEILIQPNGGQFSFPVIQFVSGTSFREIGLRGGDKMGIDGDIVPYNSTTFDLGNNVVGEHWDQVVCNVAFELSPIMPVRAKSARLDNALTQIGKLEMFSYKSGGDNLSLSFDYDVLKKHFPEATIHNNEHDNDVNTLPVIRDSAFTPLIVKAIQQQNDLIESQQILIEELRQEVEALKLKIEN